MPYYSNPENSKAVLKLVPLKITRLCIKVISVYEKGVILPRMIKDYRALGVLPLQGE